MTKQQILQYINAQYKTQQARDDHDFESRLEVALKDPQFKDLFEKQRTASLNKIKNNAKNILHLCGLRYLKVLFKMILKGIFTSPINFNLVSCIVGLI